MDGSSDIEFNASKGWCEKFMKRRHTSVCQKDPEQVIAKLVTYVLRVRRLRLLHEYMLGDIYAMDETPVWSDMITSSTVEQVGKKTVTMKSTGHEKSRISVCLTAKGDGTKLKPFIVFKGGKRDVDALNKEFHGKCVVVSSQNGWMNRRCFGARWLYTLYSSTRCIMEQTI